MILDAFFDCLPVKRKLRVHFHQFMLDVQQVTFSVGLFSEDDWNANAFLPKGSPVILMGQHELFFCFGR